MPGVSSFSKKKRSHSDQLIRHDRVCDREIRIIGYVCHQSRKYCIERIKQKNFLRCSFIFWQCVGIEKLKVRWTQESMSNNLHLFLKPKGSDMVWHILVVCRHIVWGSLSLYEKVHLIDDYSYYSRKYNMTRRRKLIGSQSKK